MAVKHTDREPITFVDSAFPPSTQSFTEVNKGGMAAVEKFRTIMIVKKLGMRKGSSAGINEGGKKKKRAGMQDERPPESYPQCLSSPSVSGAISQL